MLVVAVPTIEDRDRGDESDLWTRYAAIGPHVLGALCDAVSCALRRQSEVRLPRRPRMADACTWVSAAEPALGWQAGHTLSAWMGAREQASADLVGTDAVAQALQRLIPQFNQS
jgi:putative DNA primase/helicase